MAPRAYDPAVRKRGRGQKVFDAEPVRGTLRMIESADDVLELLDSTAEGVIAVVRDAGATFLAPLFADLTGVICTAGTLRSHIGIVTREFQVPCVMSCELSDDAVDAMPVELDCSGEMGVVRG